MHNNLETFQKNQEFYEIVVGAILKNVPCDGVLVDGGAHLGTHTNAMLNNDGVKRVYAVEAIPSLCDVLRNKFRKDPKFKLIPVAIGNKNGQTNFNIAKNSMGYSGVIQREISDVSDWEKIEVSIRTLDAVLEKDVDKVCCIKLDLEGGEFDALKGSKKILKYSKPLIVFENGLERTSEIYGYNADDFFGYFNRHGYIIYDFFGDVVDYEYWNKTLKTYMFVAMPIKSHLEKWVIPFLRNTVDNVAGS